MKPSRRWGVLALALLASGMSAACTRRSEPEQTRPNVILIMTDDQG